jgi:hypothetical protein
MAAWWMVGLEDRPERCAEICVVEVFGSAVEPRRSAEVGMGLKEFRDPDVVRDFAAPRLPIDVAEVHDYAVDWTAERAGVLRRRRADPLVPAPAGVPDADDGRRLRLPRPVHRHRRRPGPPARRRPPPPPP